jgi:hypothetical protein
MSEPVPARLHVLMAREARTAVILRRGPSNLVCTIGWNLENDSFDIGQWLKGRIDERRSDLSPDGRHMIYFAKRKGHPTKAWTAISRAPFLKAIALWFKGDSWNGGGLFTSNNSYWFNENPEHDLHQFEFDHSLLQMDPYFPGVRQHGPYDARIQRDGWKLRGYERAEGLHTIGIFEKPINERWALRKLVHGKVVERPRNKDHRDRGVTFDEHLLLDMRRGTIFDFPEWEWAEFDGSRILWAEAGKLFAASIAEAGLVSIRELRNFNDMTFEAIEAPY